MMPQILLWIVLQLFQTSFHILDQYVQNVICLPAYVIVTVSVMRLRTYI